MKYLNNKGITLIEILVTLLISTIVFAVATLLFFQVNQLWNQSTDKGNYDSKLNLASTFIVSELSEATEIYSTISSELRYQKFNGEYKMLAWNSSTQTLDLYTLQGATDITMGTPTLEVTITNHITGFSIVDNQDNAIALNQSYTSGVFKMNLTIQSGAIQNIEQISIRLFK